MQLSCYKEITYFIFNSSLVFLCAAKGGVLNVYIFTYMLTITSIINDPIGKAVEPKTTKDYKQYFRI